MQSTLATAKEPQIAMCQMTDTLEYLILGRETAQQAKGYIAWSCIPRGVPGLCEQCLTSQKHRCPATELTLGSLSKFLVTCFRYNLSATEFNGGQVRKRLI